ncbi:MAG: chromosomal replication initiator protein DnaA [Planctomycetes bacterium]|nr:chromosomal replication initiator protein DnaA [Planctomycetota bacterium]
MEAHTKEQWSSICRRVQENPHYELLSPWMNRLGFVRSSDRDLVVSLKDSSLRPFITNHHLHLLSEAAADGKSRPSVFLSDEKDLPFMKYVAKEGGEEVGVVAAEGKRQVIKNEDVINSHYKFDSLVSAHPNRLARAAAYAVSLDPGKAYNPLFIHGSVGMGKTHLLQACYQLIKETHPSLNVVYLSCEAFIHDIEKATERDELQSFYNKYLHADVLIVDNVHFLASRPGAQSALFHVFNNLFNSHKQIVFSSTVSPKSMENISETLLSRFKWGLIVELGVPTMEMRLAIINQKSAEYDLQLPEKIRCFLAQNVSGNIRELNGALLKLLGYVSLLNQDLDLTIVKEVLREYLPAADNRNLTIEEIQRATCEIFNISYEDMLSKKRARSLVLPRHIAMFLVREITTASLEEVGFHFGRRDHSTVKYGCERIIGMMEADPKIHGAVDSIKQKLLVPC